MLRNFLQHKKPNRVKTLSIIKIKLLYLNYTHLSEINVKKQGLLSVWDLNPIPLDWICAQVDVVNSFCNLLHDRAENKSPKPQRMLRVIEEWLCLEGYFKRSASCWTGVGFVSSSSRYLGCFNSSNIYI